VTRWAVQVTKPAKKDLAGMPTREAAVILAALERLAADPYACDIKKLQTGSGDLWRLRVGSWRVRFRFLKDGGIIEVVRVLPRSKGYGDL